MSDQHTTFAGQSVANSEPAMPAEIGPYRILRTIGRGGMGIVYLGESSLPKRQAAIKLMLTDRFDTEGVARFRREMDVLARLDHPGIARLFEAGSLSDEGGNRPWFAMEYIEGQSLDDYVREQKLNHRQIFGLVGQIAKALHYAHQRGVIHRDIKPANILVDHQGQPKILDFGIARLSEGGEAVGIKTRFGQIIGTLAYMSPEQFSGAHQADVRSDVYALGVVLYQLLSGQLPISIGTTSLLEAIKEVTEGRRTPLSERQPQFKGEVELIVETACQRDVEHRYDSAASFAQDLEAYLRNRPLSARKPSLAYIFGKFVRRNPLIAGALALAVVSLVVATIWSSIAADRARRAELAATQRAQETEAVMGLLTDAIREAAPDQARGKDLRLSEVLESLSQSRMADVAPGVGIRLRETLFESRMAMTDYDAATLELDQLDELCAADATHPSCWLNGARRGRFLALAGKSEQALPLLQQAISAAKTRTNLDPEILKGLEVEYADALNQTGQSEKSIALLREIIARPAAPGTLDARKQLQRVNLLSDALGEFGKLDEAEQALARAIPDAEAALGADHPTVILARNSLITYRFDRDDYAGAINEFSELLKVAEQSLGPEHRITMTILGNLAAARGMNREFDAAVALFMRRDEVFAKRYTRDWRSRLNNIVNLASMQVQRNQFQEGLDRVDGALKAVPADASLSPEWGNALSWRATFLRRLGRLDEAETQYRELIAKFVASFGEGDIQLTRYRMRLAGTLVDRKNFTEAQALLNQTLPILIEAYGESHNTVIEARGYLDQIKAATGK